MATVVFDKHVAFCEEYAARAIKAVEELTALGPSEQAMSISHELMKIRINHAPWVTEDITEKLKVFERGIFEVGHKTRFADVSPSMSEAHQEAIITLLNIVGLPVEAGQENVDIQTDKIIVYLQEALKISELAYLRDVVAKKALQISSS